MASPNILVIKLRYIGDVLLATPVLRALREAVPDGRVSMLVNRGTEEVLRHNPDLTETLVLERGSLLRQVRFLRMLRARQFDTVIDLTDGDRSAVIGLLTGAPQRVGFNAEGRWRGRCYTRVVDPGHGLLHRVERDLLALRAIGLPAASTQPTLYLSSGDVGEAASLLRSLGLEASSPDRPWVMLHPGARYWFKAWPPERFAEVADRLAERWHCHVFLGGDQRDAAAVAAISARARSKPLSLTGRATLRQFAAIVKQCALFIGNDTGAMHIAAAVGTPVLGLFGPSNPAEWGPRQDRASVLYKGLDCRTCFHPTCVRGEQNCMRLISVDEVMRESERLLTSPVHPS